LEMQVACWGMDHFSTYMRGQKFILCTENKPLEKLSKVHKKPYADWMSMWVLIKLWGQK
jgi:hypothetical protein